MSTSSRLHANAALTPRHRMLVAQLVVNDGWPISEVAARFQVSWPTVKRWVDRYLSGEPMHDRSSRPRTSPKKTPKTVTMRCVSLRMRLREGPVQLAARLGIGAAEDRRLKLAGYHVFRFGGYELSQPGAASMLAGFFDEIYSRMS